MNSKRFIPYGKQWIDDKDIEEVVKVLKSDFITQGPKVKEFEEKLAEFTGAKYAVVFNSGTSALHAAYFSLGLSTDDEFITTPLTFAATSNAGLFLQAKPVFSDVEEDTGNLDAELIEEKITSRTKLIVPVHYAGHPCDMEKIKEIADKYGLFIIEDACHALGAKYKDSKIGSCKYSDMTVFSFHPVKHITTGEGGAVLTNRKELYEKLLIFRNHGITKDKRKFLRGKEGDWYYEMHFLGFNYRMTDIQAALGISQLRKLDKFIEKRREIVKIYNAAFEDNPYFYTPVEKDYAYHSYHLYPIRLKDNWEGERKEIFQLLREKGLGVQVHYIPVYLHPYYQKLGYRKGECPVAEEFYEREISLPLYPAMSDDNIYYVVDTVFETLKRVGGM
jgi:UDP-4-amino-4,6-dideoxy-N-acetyl-beta-L-altrosamine transaminase